MKPSIRGVAIGAVSGLALVVAAGAAQAGGFAVREQSATGQGLSFAGVASGSGGLSSMFWNPAAITMKPGWNSEYHASLIIPEADITPLPPTPTLGLGGSGDIGQDAVVPASYSSYQVNDRLWIGISNSAPFGLVTDPNTVWSGQVYSRSSKIFTLNVNPIVGYKITDWLSVAVGPQIQYFDTRLKRALGTAPNAPGLILDGDDIGVGFTAGVMLTPFAGTSIGLGFRSMIEHELEGDLRSPTGIIPIRAKINTPEMVTFGISQVINPVLTVHGGIEWTNWSRAGTSAIVSPGRGVVGELPLNYDDGWFFSLGADYRVTDRITVRAGLAYEISPIDTQIRSTRLPDNDRYWASIGASYQYSEKLSFDLSYTHIFVKDTQIAIVPGHQDFAGLPFVADVDSNVNIISAAIKYRFDTPVAAAVPTTPIIRKY